MASEEQRMQAFRSRYRTGIAKWYSPWLHAGFVLVYGVALLGLFASSLNQPELWHWLLVPLSLLFFSFAEYRIHKNWGHHKTRLGKLFYQRHSGDHHRFFIEGHMRYEQACDFRVILFPAWLIVLYSLPLLVIWWWLLPIDGNLAALLVMPMLAGYLSYEVLHACEHLPPQHPIARLPWIARMRRLHELHHRRAIMATHNFGIVHPLMDWLHRSLYRNAQST